MYIYITIHIKNYRVLLEVTETDCWCACTGTNSTTIALVLWLLLHSDNLNLHREDYMETSFSGRLGMTRLVFWMTKEPAVWLSWWNAGWMLHDWKHLESWTVSKYVGCHSMTSWFLISDDFRYTPYFRSQKTSKQKSWLMEVSIEVSHRNVSKCWFSVFIPEKKTKKT